MHHLWMCEWWVGVLVLMCNKIWETSPMLNTDMNGMNTHTQFSNGMLCHCFPNTSHYVQHRSDRDRNSLELSVDAIRYIDADTVHTHTHTNPMKFNFSLKTGAVQLQGFASRTSNSPNMKWNTLIFIFYSTVFFCSICCAWIARHTTSSCTCTCMSAEITWDSQIESTHMTHWQHFLGACYLHEFWTADTAKFPLLNRSS